MIEMRWFVPVEGERRLQYRQKIDATIVADNWARNGAIGVMCPWWLNVTPVILERLL
jgi:hypothetical protein